MPWRPCSRPPERFSACATHRACIHTRTSDRCRRGRTAFRRSQSLPAMVQPGERSRMPRRTAASISTATLTNDATRSVGTLLGCLGQWLGGFELERLLTFGEQLSARLLRYRQTPDLDEADGVALVELIAAVIRRQLIAVEALRRLLPDRDSLPLVQAHSHDAGDVALRAVHVRSQVLVMRREPEAVVDQVRVFLPQQRLRADLGLRERQLLERFVRRVQR